MTGDITRVSVAFGSLFPAVLAQQGHLTRLRRVTRACKHLPHLTKVAASDFLPAR